MFFVKLLEKVVKLSLFVVSMMISMSLFAVLVLLAAVMVLAYVFSGYIVFSTISSFLGVMVELCGVGVGVALYIQCRQTFMELSGIQKRFFNELSL